MTICQARSDELNHEMILQPYTSSCDLSKYFFSVFAPGFDDTI